MLPWILEDQLPDHVGWLPFPDKQNAGERPDEATGRRSHGAAWKEASLLGSCAPLPFDHQGDYSGSQLDQTVKLLFSMQVVLATDLATFVNFCLLVVAGEMIRWPIYPVSFCSLEWAQRAGLT